MGSETQRGYAERNQKVQVMELRSYNVIRIYMDTVKCRIGDKLCVDREKLEKNAPDIRELLSQVKTHNGEAHFCACTH